MFRISEKHPEKKELIHHMPLLPSESPRIQEGEKEHIDLGSELDLPSQNDLIILEAIGGDSDAQNISFQGIKRKLGLHQETLSRALHRLQRDGFIERLDHQGYRISNKGRLVILGDRNPSTTLHVRGDEQQHYPVSILTARLPEDANAQDIVSSLSYRWFGNLRWLGFGESNGAMTMSWITNESDLKLTVKIKDDSLTIESYAESPDSFSQAVRSAYDLFDHVTRAFRGDLAKTHLNSAKAYARAA